VTGLHKDLCILIPDCSTRKLTIRSGLESLHPRRVSNETGLSDVKKASFSTKDFQVSQPALKVPGTSR